MKAQQDVIASPSQLTKAKICGCVALSSALQAGIGGMSGQHRLLTGRPGAAADLSYHLDFGFIAVTATAFFRLGAAAMVFTTSFFGFFSSRRRLVMPLAMISLL